MLLFDTIKEEFSHDIQSSDEFCVEMWSALANIQWFHKDDLKDQGATFREAGDWIASIRGRGNYLDWYCSGPYAEVSDRISDRMAKHGWRWERY